MLSSATKQTRTLFDFGGFTEWFEYQERNFGYSVGNNNYSVIIDISSMDRVEAQIAVREALEDFKGYAYTLQRRGVPVDGIGGWLDTKENKVYLDVVRHIWELSEAIEIAKVNQELAIYSLKAREVIDL